MFERLPALQVSDSPVLLSPGGRDEAKDMEIYGRNVDILVTFYWNRSQSGSGVKPWDCGSGVRDWEEARKACREQPANIPG